MKIPKKEIRDVRCKGRIPGTSVKCDEILYRSDGAFLMVGDLIINEHLDAQKVRCAKCGYVMRWRRKSNP